jgi:hypothetical protein
MFGNRIADEPNDHKEAHQCVDKLLLNVGLKKNARFTILTAYTAPSL